MRLLITGVNGQLGFDCVTEALRRGHNAVGSDIQMDFSDDLPAGAAYVPMDITDAAAVSEKVRAVSPDVIIHCAAWTDVDAAEELENREKVFAVNTQGTRNIAEAAGSVNAKMIYISTDYVFNGRGEAPWMPDCREFAPLNVYGKSKLQGELAVAEILEKYFIVRTSWVFGKNGNNFIKTMLRLGADHPSVRVVSDQIGTPTYTKDLSVLLLDMAETEKYGYYHASNAETAPGRYISWAEFAREIFRRAGLSTEVIPITTSEYGAAKAVRPLNSRLDKSKIGEAGFAPLPDWKNALSRYLREITN